MRMSLLSIAMGCLFALASCSDESAPSACGKDSDCKGDRICRAGSCESPSQDDGDSESLSQPDGDTDLDTEHSSQQDGDTELNSERDVVVDADTDLTQENDKDTETDPTAEALCLATASKCWIDGVCYSHNSPNPQSPDCAYCSGLLDQHGWSHTTRNTSCNDADPCSYNDRCDGAGHCAGTPITCESSPDDCGLKRSCSGTASCSEHLPIAGTPCSVPNATTAACDGSSHCNITSCMNGYFVSTDLRSCFDAWEDLTYELLWQDPPSDEKMTLAAAGTYCDGLELGGYTDWRLPTIRELRTLIRDCVSTVIEGPCQVGDSCLGEDCWKNCEGCAGFNGPGVDGCYWPTDLKGPCDTYWSSSSIPNDASQVWYINFVSGYLDFYDTPPLAYVRCVRGSYGK